LGGFASPDVVRYLSPGRGFVEVSLLAGDTVGTDARETAVWDNTVMSPIRIANSLVLVSLSLALSTVPPAATGSPTPSPGQETIAQIATQEPGIGRCDLALVLALDVSSSVDESEYGLQADGIANAFRDRKVINAIRATRPGGIAVTVVHWASYYQIRQVVPWTRIITANDARIFANLVQSKRRAFDYGDTGLGSAVDFAVELLGNDRLDCRRRTIDVSGDGRANVGRPPIHARDDAVARGVTINGLAVLGDDPFLEAYFGNFLVGGPEAFVMSATDYKVFPEAILRKLLREIMGPVALRPN